MVLGTFGFLLSQFLQESEVSLVTFDYCVQPHLTDRITPKVSDTWRADELYMKFKGNMKNVFALMDDETRFWLASEIADSKYVSDVRKLLVDGRELAGKRP